jgi:2-polyprenyl-3-methyl-5-hydroxy-6-metoxy-1,4-benzoquinol methylase
MNPFTPLSTRTEREEEMDAADLADARYARVLAGLARVNIVTLAARPTLAFMGAVVRSHRPARPIRILDVGFGDGGMLRAIAHWGRKHSVALDLTGIDLNPRSAAVACAATGQADGIDYRTGDYRDLAGGGWDIILSSLVTHHMSDAERQEFLRFMDTESRIGWFVNDLHRHRLPFIGYPALATLLLVDPIVRRDGQLSIARSFRAAEWEAMLADAHIMGAAIKRWFPYRLCVEKIMPTARPVP